MTIRRVGGKKEKIKKKSLIFLLFNCSAKMKISSGTTTKNEIKKNKRTKKKSLFIFEKRFLRKNETRTIYENKVYEKTTKQKNKKKYDLKSEQESFHF